MAFVSPAERPVLEAYSKLSYCNPFMPERIQLEREVLGREFIWTDDAWHKRADRDGVPPNVDQMTRRAQELADAIRGRLIERGGASDRELSLYEDLCIYFLYNVHHPNLWALCLQEEGEGARRNAPFFNEFRADLERYFDLPGYSFDSLGDAVHLFAGFYQLRRAFHYIYDNIIGGSISTAMLRASVWQSIFTHDMRRYRRALFNRIGDVATLISGPSGTGKELVAQSIGYARYIPFDPKANRFTADYRESYFPLNISALTPTLVESELFGHRKGAFTGALKDRKGWFEVCPALGAVFLDEIGDVAASIQVKLLRVLDQRQFEPIGDTESRRFEGKIIAATNRDLPEEMRAGRFREDFYYRLCSDIVRTPSLYEQNRESPEHLRYLILYLTRRVAGEGEAQALADEVSGWIDEHLGPEYPWPGNVRELEQCVRNILIRQTYDPPAFRGLDPRDALVASFREGRLSAEDLMRSYVSLVFAQCGSYQETARRLDLDRRTVKAKLDAELVERFRGG